MGRQTPVSHTSLNAVTAAGAGSSHTMNGAAHLTVELDFTGTPDQGVKAILEARISSDDFTQIGGDMTPTPTASPNAFLFTPVAPGYYGEIRLRLVQMDGGTAPTCTGKIIETGV